MTAVAVCWDPPGSEGWLEARSHGLGGSDVAAAAGLSQWKSPVDVWLSKTGRYDGGEPGEAAGWGHRLEQAVIDRWAEDRPGVIIDRPGQGMPSVVAHPDVPQARVSLDALAHDRDATVVVEAKTAGGRQSEKWADGGIPDEYAVQAAYQLAVTGLAVAYVPVLIGGQRYEERFIEADSRFTEWVLGFVLQWWQKHVVDGQRPAVDPARDLELMPHVWTPEPDSTVVLGADVVRRYRLARDLAKAAETAEKAARAELLACMGPATHALDDDGGLVATWTPSKGRASVSVADVKAKHPELVSELVKTGAPGRVLRWKQGNGDES